MKKMLILLFLASCSTQSLKTNSDISLNFDTYLSFNEFKKRLNEYIKLAPYPNINE